MHAVACSVCWVCACVTIAMAGWLHGVCVGACWVVFPQGGFSLSLFCNYNACHAVFHDLGLSPPYPSICLFTFNVTYFQRCK